MHSAQNRITFTDVVCVYVGGCFHFTWMDGYRKKDKKSWESLHKAFYTWQLIFLLQEQHQEQNYTNSLPDNLVCVSELY